MHILTAIVASFTLISTLLMFYIKCTGGAKTWNDENKESLVKFVTLTFWCYVFLLSILIYHYI